MQETVFSKLPHAYRITWPCHDEVCNAYVSVSIFCSCLQAELPCICLDDQVYVSQYEMGVFGGLITLAHSLAWRDTVVLV